MSSLTLDNLGKTLTRSQASTVFRFDKALQQVSTSSLEKEEKGFMGNLLKKNTSTDKIHICHICLQKFKKGIQQ